MKYVRQHILKVVLVVALLMVFVMPSLTSAMVSNGGFETGDFTGWTTNYSGSSPLNPWLVADSSTPLYFSFASPLSGTYDAANGFDGDGPAYFTMYQDVVATGTIGNLTFWYHAQWDMFAAPTQDRTFYIEVIDPGSNTVLNTYLILTALSGSTGDTGWTQASVSFPATSGNTYRIQFVEWIPETFTGPGQMEIDDISVVFTGGGGLNVPHVTDIRINAGSNVPAYAGPAGSQAKLAGGTDIFLPQDFDGNGYDTYVVTDTAVVDGVTWYSIFLGNESFVWVNGSQVIPQ